MSDQDDFAVGATVRSNDGRTGIIRYYGETHFAAGIWVGVELPDDSGKNDGVVQGQRYFDVAPFHGIFFKPEVVNVVAPPPAKAAATKKVGAARPSSMLNGGTGARVTSASDPALAKRMSLNAPSPSPVPRVSRSSSIARVRMPSLSLLRLYCRELVADVLLTSPLRSLLRNSS
jgi:dynactin 1